MQPSPFSAQLLTDSALAPLKKLAGPPTLQSPSAYMFYLKAGNLWGSDGLNHTPLNPALLAYFDDIFRSTLNTLGRGGLFFILSGNESGRYSIVTDNRSHVASLVQYPEALRHTIESNFPSYYQS